MTLGLGSRSHKERITRETGRPQKRAQERPPLLDHTGIRVWEISNRSAYHGEGWWVRWQRNDNAQISRLCPARYRTMGLTGQVLIDGRSERP